MKISDEIKNLSPTTIAIITQRVPLLKKEIKLPTYHLPLP